MSAEKIAFKDIDQGVKFMAVVLGLVMTFGSSFATYKLMDYRLTELEKGEIERKVDHEKVLLIERDVKDIKVKTDAIYDFLISQSLNSGSE